MVLAYHVIFSLYGFWLPNDERGSWSDFVGAWELLRFGDATKTDTRRSVASRPFDKARRDEARRALKYPPVLLTGHQAKTVGEGFQTYINKSRLLVHACSILPDHVHMVLARHTFEVEHVVNQLKGAATRRLTDLNLHPFAHITTRSGRHPKPWARGQWKVFLDSTSDIERAIQYVIHNPIKEGKPAQRWSFVTPNPP